MKISVVPTEGNILSICLEEEVFCLVHPSIVGRRPFFPSSCDSSEDLKKLVFELVQKGAKRHLLKRLSQRSYSSGELKKSLREKLVPQAIVETLIEECQKLGYLNDEAWIEAFVRSCRTRKMGKRAIIQKIRQKGIEIDQIEPFLPTKEQESEGIVRLLETRYRHRDLKNRKEKDKVIAALIRKGYSLETVLETLKNCQL